MTRKSSLLFATLLLSASLISAQSVPTSQDLTFQVAAGQAWIDTGLDLQSGDIVKISATASSQDSPVGQSNGSPACSPAGVAVSGTNKEDLPLPGAPAGALIARLHAHGASPVLVGASTELHVEGASHLLLGMNTSATPPCRGAFAVKVQKTVASANETSTAGAEQKTRGAQLKSQLSTAADVFLEGQFGIGKSESGALNATSAGEASPAAVPLKVSDAALDAALRKNIDSLPRRINDQFNNLGDMVNFVIVGTEKNVQAALEAASWHIADADNRKAVLNALTQTYDSKDYLAMPMSTLFLFGRKQDFGYELAEPIAMVASRHHFRIWKAPFTWNGQEVWVGAGTHDIGFAKDKRNNNVTHKIDPAVDGERDNIGVTLQKAAQAKTLSYYLPPNPVQEAKNATGDGYHSDGRLLVIFLQ
jgi:hypothetical protein